MALRYKLPKQAAAAIPLDAACTIQTVKQYIETENHITSAFKLRVYVGGMVHYLKPSQTLAEVAALGTNIIIGVNFYDDVAKKLARRQLAKETAALVRTDVREDGDKTRQQVQSSMDAVKECIRDEIQKLSTGPSISAGVRRTHQKLLGRKVIAAQPDAEMGDDTYEISHVEEQTFPDGKKHTVCLIKAEGRATLSRKFSNLSLSDPFAGNGLEQVRVVVKSRPDDSVFYHVGWRATVQKTLGLHEARVNFSYLRDGKIANKTIAVRKEHLEILAADDVSQMPNKHPWVGEPVKVDEGTGKIVHVEQGRVKILLDNSKKKKFAFVESRGASFDELFGGSPTTEVLEQPQAALEQQAADKAVPQADDSGRAVSVADSDAESDAPALIPLPSGDGEPVAPAEPKRKRGAEKKKKAEPAKPAKKRRAATPSAPKRAVRRKVEPPIGQDVD